MNMYWYILRSILRNMYIGFFVVVICVLVYNKEG